jgi:hypothetical protein
VERSVGLVETGGLVEVGVVLHCTLLSALKL